MTRQIRSATRSRETTALLVRHYVKCHASALRLVAELSGAQFRWRPPKGPQSIGWNLWHVARWDDFLAEVLVARTASLSHIGPPKQVWKSQGFAAQWGLDAGKLGIEDAGTGLDDEEAAAIAIPAKDAVVAYTTEAFSHLDRVFSEVDDSLLPTVLPGALLFPGQLKQDTYGDNIVIWLMHACEHLGMMEAAKGMLGLRGSVGD